MEKVEFSLEGFEDREADNYEEESLRVIISDASDLDELEQEWKDFMSMPKAHRIDSDRESIELYGKTNEERYREQKAKFLNSRKEDIPKEYKGVTEESEYEDPKYQNPPKELEQYRDRFKLFDPKTKELARRWAEDSMIPMVIPYGSWEDLDKMWNDVCSVSIDKRTKSDTKCMELFGMKNEELYNFMTNQLNCIKSIESELMKHPDTEHGPSEENVNESYIEEMKRSDLKDSEFGLPKLRKYPMPDKDHVLSAIKFFNYVSPENEKELAKNIKKKMKQYNVSSDHIGDKNRLKKYIKEEYELEEACYNISNGMNIEESFELINEYEPKNIYESTLLELAGSDDTVECTGDTLWAEMPFFSPDEMINYGVFSGEGNRFFPIADNNTIGKLTTEQWFKEYYTRAKGISTMAENIQSDWIMTLNKLYMDYDNLLEFGTDDEINARKQSILELGWNPNIPFTPENRVKATKNTIKKIKENYNNFSIVRVRGGEESNIVEETVQNKDKYPVSIVLIKGNSLLAKTITKVTKSNVSHVAICLDDNLKKLYSFNARGEFNGLSYESFNSYKKDGVKEAIVFTFFLKKDQYKMLEKNIEYYILNQNKTKYSFINLASIPLNVSVGFDMKMVCSEFVDRILKLSNIDFTGKKFTLVTPNDIYTSIKNNSKVYLIYQGALDKLNVNKAVNKIKKLAKSANLLQESIYMISESNDESYIDKNHKQNGQKSLSDFKFSKTKNNDEGKSYNLYWKDDNDKLVGKVTVDTIPASDGYRWFGNLEVSKKYRGYGLGKQILDIAVKKYKAGALAVYKDNEIAYNMYKKYGFKNATDRSSKDYHYMYLERNRDKFIKESYIPVLEVKEFPVQFDEDGNLLIKNIKRIDFEKEYSNAHRLLMVYDKNKNTEGMKYELAKLQFLNDILENHIYYDKKSTKKDYYVKVRARILNDFNKYLSVLLKLEPLFVFGEYYQSTPFSDAVIKIRSSTLKHGIQLIKSLF